MDDEYVQCAYSTVQVIETDGGQQVYLVWIQCTCTGTWYAYVEYSMCTVQYANA